MRINSTKTSALQKRILAQTKQSVDLNKWIFSKLRTNDNPRVLELCCGTGAQSKFLFKMVSGGSLDCVDINEETIEENKKYVSEANINYHVSDIDVVNNYELESIDLIFSSYGFYYSKDPVHLHNMLVKKLKNSGKFVLVGPVLGNNSELYSILKEIGIKISDDVLYSSEKFMLEMQEVFLNNYHIVKFDRVLNRVTYESISDLLNYWKNTTFYEKDKEEEFMLAASRYYKGEIVVTKSISYLEGAVKIGKE